MYPIDTGCKTINGERVDTFIRGIVGKNSLLEVEAGTNGRCSHGRNVAPPEKEGRAYIRIAVLNKADFYARVKCNEAGQPVAVELCFGGDDGIDAARKAVGFVHDVFRDQMACFNE